MKTLLELKDIGRNFLLPGGKGGAAEEGGDGGRVGG